MEPDYYQERDALSSAEPPAEMLKLGAKLLLLISVQINENLVHGGVRGRFPCLFIFFYLVKCLCDELKQIPTAD